MPEYWGGEPWRRPTGGTRSILTDRFTRLLSGQLKPWQLPEFQGMEHTLAKRGALAREGAGRQARAMGVKGPAVASMLGKMEEGQMAPLGQAMQATYGQLPYQAMSWQQHLDALEEAGKGRGLRQYLGERAIGAQEKASEQQWIMSLLRLLI